MQIVPEKIEFYLPAWLKEYAARYTPTDDVNERMRFVVDASRENIERQTGGPFAAGIFEIDSGELVTLGVNLVTTEKMSLLHGETVAIALAQRRLGTYDLSAARLELATSTEPCAMCYGATLWSGVRRLVAGAREEDATAAGFDEGPKVANWREEMEARGIEVIRDIERERAANVLQDYREHGGPIYNPQQP